MLIGSMRFDTIRDRHQARLARCSPHGAAAYYIADDGLES
jgi:hypothetical protein